MKQKKNYVNNKDLLDALIIYKAAVKEAKEQGKQKPQLPDYIGKCILLIATKLNNAPNFYNYSYKEEMIGDGIENCVKYLDNFDPERYKNPFAYITTICYRASIRRITAEKKQTIIKSEMVKNSGILEYFESNQHHLEDGHFENGYLQFLLEMADQKPPSDKEPKVKGKPGRKSKAQKAVVAKTVDYDPLLGENTTVKEDAEDEPLADFFDEEIEE